LGDQYILGDHPMIFKKTNVASTTDLVQLQPSAGTTNGAYARFDYRGYWAYGIGEATPLYPIFLNGAVTVLDWTTSAGSRAIRSYKLRGGSIADGTYPLQNDGLGIFSCAGWVETAGNVYDAAYMRGIANQTWAIGKRGARLEFLTTADNAAAVALAMAIYGDKSVKTMGRFAIDGGTAVAKPTITGVVPTTAPLKQVLTFLAQIGFLVDNTTNS
jgi:hypothetical protein